MAEAEEPVGQPCTSQLISTSIKPFHALFEGRDPFLVDYCLLNFLPSQYHQGADGKSTVDLSYLCYLCLDSPPLLNAIAACATIDLSRHGNMKEEESARKLYTMAISEISTGIASRALTGTEDHLLATVIWLCVFEVGTSPFSSSFLSFFSFPLLD